MQLRKPSNAHPRPAGPGFGWFCALAFLLASPSAVAVQVVAAASGNWSSTATWVGGVLPDVEDTVMIPTGLTVTLNADVECGGIVVEGKLTVERADHTLLCDYLLVQTAGAKFEVGTSASRFLQKFTLTLKGLATESAMGAMGGKVLGAHNGGTLDIHGRDRVEWTHLDVSSAVGATSLTLAEPVDWEVGDSILVTSSGQNWDEAGTRTITSVSPDLRTVFFTSGLGYPHNGRTITKTRSTDGKSWTGDLRAEVGLMSRNVKIQGDAVSETAGYGGHIMVMNGGPTCCATCGKAFIEGVELYRLGQKSLLARYPMHWHMVADGGVGQYFKDSVVRHSFNRAITIHGTESTLVENNFCYDHLGHGIFLEDGSERFNVIRKNVVLGTKRPVVGEEILDTDNAFNAVQNRSPASFWITNPNNTFTDNVAAGTVGTGYWFAFPQKPLNASLTHPRFVGLEPYKQPLGAFSGNTAHSCASGLDINDQLSSNDTLVSNGEWANNGPFYFENCTWYANDIALYAGVGGARKNVVYRNNVFSDNETNLFLATYQLCEESLMVANSGFGLLPSSTLRFVYDVYDGAARMKNNHIVGYNASNTRFLHNTGAAIKHPNHRFEGLTFEPPNTVRSTLTDYNLISPANIGANDPGHPRIWALVILDVDGSISGVPNSSIIGNHPFMLTGGETRPLEWTNMYRSDHRFAQLRLDYGIPFGSIPNVSVVRTKAGTPTRGVYYINGYNEWHQLPLIVREDFLYTYSYESLPSTKKVNVNFSDAEIGDDYVVRFKDFGKLPGIAVSGMTSRASLSALKAGTSSGYYKEANGDFYIRPVATADKQTYTITWTSDISVPVVDSDGDGVSDGDEAAAGTDPFRTVNGTEPFENSEFDVAGNFENWAAFSGIGSATVAGGLLGAVSTNTDSQMIETNLRVSGDAVRYLLVRMKASKNGDAQFYWERLGINGYSSARSVTANYSGGNQWRVLAIPMQGNAEWLGKVITSLRFDPVSTTGTNFSIDSIVGSDGKLIVPPPDQATDIGVSTGAIPFDLTINLDGDSTFAITATSSNPSLVPNAGIVLAGTGTHRTVAISPAPNQSGTSTITLTASNGSFTSSSTFTLAVTNTPPTVGTVANQTIALGSSGYSSFTVGDASTSPAALTLSATSSNPSLVPVSGITFTGTGTNRGVTITPTALQVGTATITLNVSDGELTTSATFTVTVDGFASGRFAFLFNQEGNFEGWAGNSMTSAATVAGGALTATLTGVDPQFNRSTALNIQGSNVPIVLVRMTSSAGGNAQLFFGNELGGITGANSVTFNVPAGGAYRWYAVNVAANANWSGHTIKALRLDPPSSSGTTSIDAIIGSAGDFNQNGLSDGWEAANQLDPTAPADPLRDSDGDGLTDAVEFTFGTNPNAWNNSAFFTATTSGATITFTFVAIQASGTGYAGLTRIYDVEMTTNLADPASWTGIPNFTDITGADQTVTVPQPLSAVPHFYRLKVRVQ